MLRRGVGGGDRQASGRAMNYNKAVGAARHSIARQPTRLQQSTHTWVVVKAVVCIQPLSTFVVDCNKAYIRAGLCSLFLLDPRIQSPALRLSTARVLPYARIGTLLTKWRRLSSGRVPREGGSTLGSRPS